MATQMTPSHRTQGDGMEKVEYEIKNEKKTVVSDPIKIDTLVMPKIETLKISSDERSFKGLNSKIKLTPPSIDKKKTGILGNIKNKEPKFVPYEPYKAAIRPIVPPSKKSAFRKKVKPKEFVNTYTACEKTSRNEIYESEGPIAESPSNGNQDFDLHSKLEVLKSELQALKEENKELESQLKFQVQVNGELKNLLVAALGEDMETKVHVLTEDKLHLAQALLRSAETLSSHQEQTEWLAGQCEVWRSKFLASSVMVEELARWKASLSQKVDEYHESLKKFLEERKLIRENVAATYYVLCELRQNFDFLNRNNKLSSSLNILDICKQNLKMTDTLLIQLLGNKKPSVTVAGLSENLEKTPAEKYAEHVLSNPSLLQLIGEPDAACSAVVGAANILSGELYLQNHPPKISCCSHCTGQIKLV